MPFQSQVNVQPAIGVPGDYCDLNPRYTVDAGPGGLVAGANGVTVGLFAWAVPPTDADGSPAVANNYGSGMVTGFVHREQQALFTQYLQEVSLTVPAGFPVTLHSGGGFFAKNSGTTQALPGMKAYANLSTGAVTFAATGSATAGATSTASTISAQTASVTASIANNVMSVTVVGSGTIVPGGILSGTNVASGTQVSSQITPLLSGEAIGGVGRYYVSIPEQTVASTTISETYGLLTIGGTVAGSYGVGQALSGAATGTTITALGTGTGGAGTYIVTPTQTVSSGAINAVAINVETKWFARSSGLPGETVKISDQPLG